MKSGSDDAPQRRRKPAAVRRREIAEVAAELFARQGFGVSTRTISDALGVIQAALYRHYKSKDELIEEAGARRVAACRRIAIH